MSEISADFPDSNASAGVGGLDNGVVDIELTGANSQWFVRYPGAARPGKPKALTGTALRLPAHSNIRLRLGSRDYVYLLSLPEPDRTQVAVPGLAFVLDFATGQPGALVLQGDHMCGIRQPALTINALVEPEALFEAWLRE